MADDTHTSVPEPVVPKAPTTQAPLPEVDLVDYWAHKVAEEAKKKIIAWFTVLGVSVSIAITLFGMDRINVLIDSQYEKQIQKKEQETSQRVKDLASKFEQDVKELRHAAVARKEEYDRILGTSLAKLREAGQARTTLEVDFAVQIGPIGDLGADGGATVGFALAYALSGEVTRKSDQQVAFSARSIYTEAKRYDEWPGEDYEGTSVIGGLEALKRVGAFLESDWPYASPRAAAGKKPAQRISGYNVIPKDRFDLILEALQARRPVVAEISVSEAFGEAKADGRIKIGERQHDEGSHVVCLVGYSGARDEVKFANMWGTEWGASGFGILSTADLLKIMVSAATLDI